MVMMFFVGKAFSERDEKALKALVPIALSMFMYTVVIGLASLLITDLISVGQFAEWCGTKLNIVKK
jgi:hypothetical protein